MSLLSSPLLLVILPLTTTTKVITVSRTNTTPQALRREYEPRVIHARSVSSAGTFPRRVVVQRESNVSQPGKRLAAAGAERAEGSSKKRDQTRPHTSRTACGEAAIAEGFLILLPRAAPRRGTHGEITAS